MSTTKQSRNMGRNVTSLPEVKRRRRLENLLYTRKRVSQLASEYRSHGLDEAVELYLLQLEIEQVIANATEFRPHRLYPDRVMMLDRTDGGRRATVVARYDAGRHSLRPVTAWEEP